MNNGDKMKEGDLVIYTDSWGDKKQALFIRYITQTIVEIVRMDGLRLQTPAGYIKKGVHNEDR
jgi:hypothetical protein